MCIKYKNKLIIELNIRINMYLIMHLFILNIQLKMKINEHLIMELNIWMNCPPLFGKRKGKCGGILTFEKHSTNMKIFWNIKRTFKKYTNICIFFECSFNIFLKNIEKKNLVFYKCSFNILNKIWDLAPCVNAFTN